MTDWPAIDTGSTGCGTSNPPSSETEITETDSSVQAGIRQQAGNSNTKPLKRHQLSGRVQIQLRAWAHPPSGTCTVLFQTFSALSSYLGDHSPLPGCAAGWYWAQPATIEPRRTALTKQRFSVSDHSRPAAGTTNRANTLASEALNRITFELGTSSLVSRQAAMISSTRGLARYDELRAFRHYFLALDCSTKLRESPTHSLKLQKPITALGT